MSRKSSPRQYKRSQLSHESPIIATIETSDESKTEDIALKKIFANCDFQYYYTDDKQQTIMEFDDGGCCQMSTYRFFLFMDVVKNLLGLDLGNKKEDVETEFIY